MKTGRYFLVVSAAMLFAALGLKEASARTAQLNRTVSSEALELPTFGDLLAQQTLPLQIWCNPVGTSQRDQEGNSHQDAQANQDSQAD